jgi:hypothetical protein
MLRLWHKVICDAMRSGDQMLPIIPILEQVPYLGGSSKLIHRRRTFYGVVGSLIGIYLNSTAALAEVEEVRRDPGGSINSSLSIDPLPDDDDNISEKDLVKFHLDEDLVPEAVWSLHNNVPVRLDRIRDGVESPVDTGAGAHFDSPTSWIRTSYALWIGNSMYTSGGLLPVPPLQFQVASCGGSHAERRDLDHCSLGGDVLRQEIEEQSLSDTNNGNNASEDANDIASSSKDVSSSSNANDQSTSSLSTPIAMANPQPQGGLIAPDPCGGASAVCAIVDLGLPGTPIDLPTVDSPPPLIDDLALTIDVPALPIDVLPPPIDVLAPPTNPPLPVAPPPIPVPVLDDPGRGADLPPLFTSPPVKPIPEASTWVMTITGFSIIALAFRKKRRPRINPISIIDVSDV